MSPWSLSSHVKLIRELVSKEIKVEIDFNVGNRITSNFYANAYFGRGKLAKEHLKLLLGIP